MEEYRDKYEHHLMLKMAGERIDEARNWLSSFFDDNAEVLSLV